ncbi:outer membrane beta-barrel protein [Aurantiacibacter hainanensis]|uniref:outer membrane beta-barrel protein n=1 Tax=Aurantiacibacter hainanensis TaxID=3076114 RepID=UPI0030C71140
MNTRNIALAALSIASGFIAMPAAANEARVEARGGIFWAGDAEEATVGVAAGYDFDLGESLFVGAEVSADKVLVDDSDIYAGLTGRLGTRLGENGRLFAAGGYTVSEGEDVPHLGAGFQYALGEMVYFKTEYRHFFSDFADGDTLVAGIGARF